MERQTRSIRVGLIGAGSIGAVHAETIATLDGARLVAAVARDSQRLDAFCRRFGCTAHSDYHAMLADPAIDAVVIALPHHLHAQVAAEALEAGKHVLLEKPMAPTLAECDRILQAAAVSPSILMLGHVMRFAPAYQAAKRLLTSGELGPVVFMESRSVIPWQPERRRAWHLDRASGGGMLLTQGVHVVDRLCWLMDDRVQSVRGTARQAFHDARTQDVDDVAIALLTYSGGAQAIFTVAGFQRGITQVETDVHCAGGRLRVSHRNELLLGQDDRWEPVAFPGREERDWRAAMMRNQWHAFLDSIRHNTAPEVTGEFGRHTIAVLEAIRSSTESGREEPVGG